MTLQGPVRASGARPGSTRWRIDVAALGAATSDLPTIVGAPGLGAAAKLWVPFVVAAALARLRVRGPRVPRDARDDRRRPGHRRW